MEIPGGSLLDSPCRAIHYRSGKRAGIQIDRTKSEMLGFLLHWKFHYFLEHRNPYENCWRKSLKYFQKIHENAL